MISLRTILTTVVLAICLLSSSAAFAQKAKETPKAVPKGYTLSYTLALLAIGLGVYVSVKPSTRGKKAKRRDDDDD